MYGVRVAAEFRWSLARHVYSPDNVKHAIQTVTMIRSLHHASAISLLPNELLFILFEYAFG